MLLVSMRLMKEAGDNFGCLEVSIRVAI